MKNLFSVSAKEKYQCSLLRLVIFYALLLLNSINNCYGQNGERFINLGSRDGINSNNAICAIKDQSGYVWIGTDNGLYRYNGYEMKGYFNDPVDSTTLSMNDVSCLAIDKKGILWIGTWGGGLNIFNKVTEKFTRIKLHTGDGLDSLVNTLFSIYIDSSNIVWLGTSNHGIFKINNERNKIDHFNFINRPVIHTRPDGENCAQSFIEITPGQLLIGTTNGLIKFNKQTCRYTRFNAPQHKNYCLYQFVKENDNEVWIATWGNGIVKFNSRDTSWTEYNFNSKFKGTSNIVWSVSEKNKDELYVASIDSGFGVFNKISGKFKFFRHRSDNPYSICSDLNAKNIFHYDSNSVWFLGAEGISALNKRNNNFNEVSLPKSNGYYSNFLSLNTIIQSDNKKEYYAGGDLSDGLYVLDSNFNCKKIYSINKDESKNGISYIHKNPLNNEYIINTYYNGFLTFNPHNKTIKPLFTNARHLDTLNFSSNHSFIDSKNNLWFDRSRHGIYCYSLSDSTVKNYRFNEKDIKAVRGSIYGILETSDGNIMAAYNINGFGILSQSDLSVTNIAEANIKGYKIKLQEVCFSHDHIINNQDLLISTLFDGAFIYNMQSRKFTRNFSTENGLPSNRVGCAVRDNSNSMWLTTGNGLAELNLNDYSIKNYNDKDGIEDKQDHQLFNRPLLKGADGKLFLSVTGGFYYWDPKHFYKETIPPQIAFDFFKVLNKDYTLINDTNINYLSTVTLPHDSNFFSFQFAAMHFVLPERNRYSYFLEGVDRQWTKNTLQRMANYTNVSPGHYTFHVKAANCDGVWGTERKLNIIITPAWYQTLWFKFLIGLIAIGILYVIYLVRLRQVKLQKEKELALNTARMKDAFLARMSHEIRTPMNAIMGMNQILLDKQPRNDQLEYLNAIEESTVTLLSLINEILDYAKIESGKMHLEDTPFSIKECIQSAANTIKHKALEKNVGVNCLVDDLPELVMGDPVRLKQILINLAGNAEKFTEHGEITLSSEIIGSDNEYVQCKFTVSDTGIGIPQEKLSSIFESFTQAGSDITRRFGGTGLGLTISKQLIELHKSSINVSSEVNKGTAFSFTIKYKKALDRKESDQNLKNYIYDKGELLSGIKILLAEDNKFNGIVAIDMLKKMIPGLQIDLADDGTKAIELLQKNKYDLLLLDIMMPQMDGYETIEHIRKKFNEPLRSIKVIAMTANATRGERDKCFETGMNGYIAKPLEKKDVLDNLIKVLISNPPRDGN
ncbi:MAG: ATP-binding protein [Bacteroidia bacterium]